MNLSDADDNRLSGNRCRHIYFLPQARRNGNNHEIHPNHPWRNNSFQTHVLPLSEPMQKKAPATKKRASPIKW